MTLLVVVGTLIALATVGYLAHALRAARAVSRENREDLAPLRDRLLAQLRELDVEEGDRNIDAATAADERRRLEAELAQVLKALEADTGSVDASPSGSRRRAWLVALLALLVAVPLVSAALYLTQHAPVLAQLDQAGALARGDVPPMVLEMVGRLERRLAEQPDDPKGWARLGRAYAVLGRVQDAEQAYTRAYRMAPEDVEVVADYAAFLLSRDAPELSPEAVVLFRELHALEPQHPGALWGLGLAAYRESRFGEAVNFWEQLLNQLPPGSEVAPQVRHAIESARAEAAKRK